MLNMLSSHNNNNNKGKGKGPGTCCSMKHDQRHFTIWQVAADWLAPRYSTAACYVTIQYQCLSQWVTGSTVQVADKPLPQSPPALTLHPLATAGNLPLLSHPRVRQYQNVSILHFIGARMMEVATGL